MPGQPPGSGGGGGVLGLGPAQNTFGDATTANRAAAEALRDAYANAQAAWLALYNENRSFWIRLVWAAGTIEQRRNAAGDAWEDVTNVIRGRPGAAGADGTPGGGAFQPVAVDQTVTSAAANEFVATGITIEDNTLYRWDHPSGNGVLFSSAPLFAKNPADAGDVSADASRVNLGELAAAPYPGTVRMGHTAAGELLLADSQAGANDIEFSLYRYVPAAAQGGGLTEAQVQALINATPLSALQGQLLDGQIPAAIMRDAEFTAAAVRNLLSLTAAEVNDLLTGATISGQVITFTQNDGSTVEVTVPQGGMADGVVASGAFNADADELVLTLDTGTAVVIDVPALLRQGAGGGTALSAEDEGTEVDGSVSVIDFIGDGVTVTQTASGEIQVNIPGGGGTQPTHTDQYLAGKADGPFAAGDFTGAAGVAYDAASHTATMPAVAGNVKAAVARLASDPAPTYADVNGQGINQIADFTQQAGTIEINTDTYDVYVSDYAVFATGDRVEFR